MKVALFKSPQGFTAAYDQNGGDAMVKYTHYTRVSEYVDVEFPPIPLEALVEGQLSTLSNIEIELRSQFETRLKEIEIQRAQLAPHTGQS